VLEANAAYTEGKMLGRTRTALAAMFLSVAGALTPVSVSAITVGTFVSQEDHSLRANELQQAINNVLGPIQKKLRSAKDVQGNPKSEQQMRQDSQLADRILDIMNHIDQDELARMMVDASRRQPNVQMEDVIATYIVQQLKQPQNSSKPSSPT
jgi:hypothetical protein